MTFAARTATLLYPNTVENTHIQMLVPILKCTWKRQMKDQARVTGDLRNSDSSVNDNLIKKLIKIAAKTVLFQ